MIQIPAPHASRFQFLETADGSPTLNFLNAAGQWETMHNRKGAFSETLYIYDKAIELAMERSLALRALSLGLGLGYNEFILAARSLLTGADLFVESFETEQVLKDQVLLFMDNKKCWLEPAYSKISGLVAQHFSLDPKSLVECMATLLRSGHWKMSGSISESLNTTSHYNLIFFDAYSSNTSPELWTEEWISRFLESNCDEPCILTTYAMTGNLRRALKTLGFTIQNRPGYGGKRESTLATLG